MDVSQQSNITFIIVCDPQYFPACCIYLVKDHGYTNPLYAATDDTGITIYFCSMKETVPNVFIGEECGD